MSFTAAIRSCLAKFATFSGRARRSEYWYFALLQVLIWFGASFAAIIGAILAVASPSGLAHTIGLGFLALAAVFGIIPMIPSAAVFCRRMHDTNRSGWWWVIGFVPFGSLVLIAFALQDSGPDNQYGPSPKPTRRRAPWTPATPFRPRPADLVVDPADVPAGLRALRAGVKGRVPSDVEVTVRRICEILLAALTRLEGQNDVVLRSAATDYLPRTLRSYTMLPPDWAATHRLDNGRTALENLREQLAVLEAAVIRSRDAALRADAAELLVNGTFLADRFATSNLDLPS